MTIRHPAVFVAALAHWIAGGLWYGVFSGIFAGYIGQAKLRELETRSEAAAFSLAFLASLVLAYVLAALLRSEEPHAFGRALRVVVLVWAGFIAATQSLTVLFEG